MSAAGTHYHIIVIGVGSMGAAACYYLAKRGVRVLGIEQFDIPHDRGSHAGQSRIIRKAYFEHLDYVPLLQRSYENWRAVERETGQRCYYDAGIVYFGAPDNATMKGVRRSAELFDISVSGYDHEEASKQWPMFRLPNDFSAIFEPDAGLITPERAVAMFASEAKRLGATIKTRTAVLGWKRQGRSVHVTTETGEFTAEKLVICAGAWTSRTIPELAPSLRVTRQLLMWVMPESPSDFTSEKFPCWFVEDPELGSFYGFPVVPQDVSPGPVGLKLAHHRPGRLADPEQVAEQIPESEVEILRNFLRTYLPAVGEDIIATRQCLYTNSPDEHFVIDHLPGSDGRVIVACGFSGHGFKFVPVVGEVLADLAETGRTDLPIAFLRYDRFQSGAR